MSKIQIQILAFITRIGCDSSNITCSKQLEEFMFVSLFSLTVRKESLGNVFFSVGRLWDIAKSNVKSDIKIHYTHILAYFAL